jgi:membrane-bound serine protease (ClpP class)
MDPILIIILLAAAGAVLLVAELLLPTHGVLGVTGGVCLAAGLAGVFLVNRWLGLAIFLAMILSSPFLFTLVMRIWAGSPVGRRLILQSAATAPAPSAVRPGQTGTTVTELRPTGECEFGEHRLEAVSELGIIPAGRKIRVVAVDNGRPTVRLAEV